MTAKIIDFLKDKYAVIFILFTTLLAGAFFLYSEVLGVVQRLLETGNIKFLFNMQFITTLQTILKYSYCLILIVPPSIIPFLFPIFSFPFSTPESISWKVTPSLRKQP